VTIEDFVALLKAVTGPNPKGWYSAKCPGHEDREASLGVKGGDRGIILKCHAGCTAEAIVAALGLTLADLFLTPHSNTRRDSSRKSTTKPFESTYRKSKGPPRKKRDLDRERRRERSRGGGGLHHPETVRTLEQFPPTVSGSPTTPRRRACRRPFSAGSAA
jgi:hypothetical protein